MGSVLLRILFIGNSLTAANDLPAMLEAIARADGVRLQARVVAFPDHSLEDHWARGDARAAIRDGRWDVVVLQQGPSALPESRRLLIEYAKRFAGEVRQAGARPALYMVWPSARRGGDFDGVRLSYARAAEEVDGMLFPVGEGWRAAWRRDSRLALYGPDGFHPSAAGSYLAALVMYQQLTGRSPAGIPSPLSSIPPDTVRLLQEAAAEANARFGRR
jgi:hypothetical protein